MRKEDDGVYIFESWSLSQALFSLYFLSNMSCVASGETKVHQSR